MVNRRAITVVVAAFTAGLLAACSSSTPPPTKRSSEFFSEAVYGKASPRVVAAGQAVPKGGGRVVVGKPYNVAGETYIPRDNPDYTATGLASWYGEAFHGRLTANGEVYDINGLTAAHPTMPLPSYARVTNLKNGRSMIVRVNDRGPFHRNRVIDVSARVADMLGFKRAGTGKVRVDYVGPADMDGLDHNRLMASYSEGGGTTFGGSQAVMVAAAAPVPRLRPAAANAYQSFPATNDPMLLAPDADPLGPLILRTGFANGYAPAPGFTGAQAAAEALATSTIARDDLQAALERAAARKARELEAGPAAAAIVQLGTFSDPENARRVARDFSRFGVAEQLEDRSGGRTLIVVRVTVDPSVGPDSVISAAADAGLPGAFRAQ